MAPKQVALLLFSSCSILFLLSPCHSSCGVLGQPSQRFWFTNVSNCERPSIILVFRTASPIEQPRYLVPYQLHRGILVHQPVSQTAIRSFVVLSQSIKARGVSARLSEAFTAFVEDVQKLGLGVKVCRNAIAEHPTISPLVLESSTNTVNMLTGDFRACYSSCISDGHRAQERNRFVSRVPPKPAAVALESFLLKDTSRPFFFL